MQLLRGPYVPLFPRHKIPVQPETSEKFDVRRFRVARVPGHPSAKRFVGPLFATGWRL